MNYRVWIEHTAVVGLCVAAAATLSSCTGGNGRDTDGGSGIDSISTGGTGGTAGTGDTEGTAGTGPVATGGATETSGVDTGATTEQVDPPTFFLLVDPPESIIELDLDTPTTLDLTVTAYYDNGDQADVTADVEWTVSNPMVGSMNGATLEVPGYPMPFFESSILTATLDDREGAAQVTIAAYQQSGPEPDFFFVLPFEDPAGNQAKDLTFSTDVKSMDVFFNMDTTGSMDGEVSNLQNSLTSTVIPGIVAVLPNTWFGVGAYEDFPVSPYGESNCTYGALGGPDQPFQLFTEITSDVVAVQTAVNQLGIGGNAIGCGNDFPESAIEALYQIATGDGLASPAPTSVATNHNGVGGVNFRTDTMPVVVNITDAPSHDPGSAACAGEQYTGAVATVAHSQTEAMTALNNICARVIQVATASGASCTAQADGIQWNNATGAVVPPEAWDVAGHPPGCAIGQCCTGINGAGVAPQGGMCPLTYLASGTGTGVDSSIVAGIEMVARYSPFDVTREWDGITTDQEGVPLPAGTTTADFIKAVTPLSHGPVPVPGVPNPVLTPTTFEGVVPDTDVTFSVEAYNDFVPQGPDPRLFVATIRVLADDCGELDERDVFILVPPEQLAPPR